MLNKNKNVLIVSYIAIIFLFFTSGILTYLGLREVTKITQKIYSHPLVVSNASITAAYNITKMHRSMKDVVLSKSFKEAERHLARVASYEKIVYSQLDLVKTKILGKEGQMLEAETRQLFIDWKPIREEVVMLFETGDHAAAIDITKEKGADHVVHLEDKMIELNAYARNKANEFFTHAQLQGANIGKIDIIIIIIGISISIMIAMFTTITIMKSNNILLAQRNELQKTLDEIKTLQGIIPICSYCKEIRDDEGSWKKLEEYIQSHTDANFSHGVCPTCMQKYFPDLYDPKDYKNE